jgi:hypothetical protein
VLHRPQICSILWKILQSLQFLYSFQFEFLKHKNKRIQRYSWLRQKPSSLHKPIHISPVRFNSYPEQETAKYSEMLVTTYMIAQCHNSEDQSPYFNFLRNLKPHIHYYFSAPKVIQLTGSSSSFIPRNYFCAYEFCHFATFTYPDLLLWFCKTIQKFWYSMHLTYSATRISPASPFDEQACGWMSSHHTYRWRVQRDCFLATSVGCA